MDHYAVALEQGQTGENMSVTVCAENISIKLESNVLRY